jgi:hypothetical protein
VEATEGIASSQTRRRRMNPSAFSFLRGNSASPSPRPSPAFLRRESSPFLLRPRKPARNLANARYPAYPDALCLRSAASQSLCQITRGRISS